MTTPQQEDQEVSDEELAADDWPADFFEDDAGRDFNDLETVNIDAINPLEKENTEHPVIDGRASFKDLPPALLAKIIRPLGLQDRAKASRMNRSMHKAISKSDLRLMGDGKLEVSTVMTKYGIEEVTVYLGGLKEIHQKITTNWMLDPAPPPVGMREFGALSKLFGKLHLKELRLNNVPIENPLFQHLIAFIYDCCTYDKLSLLIMTRDIWTEMSSRLIIDARKEVLLEIGADTMSIEQAVAITRPVTFRYFNRNWSKHEFFTDNIFMELVFNGHSIIGFHTMLRSVQCISLVVESVCASAIPQMIDVRGLNYAICSDYVNSVNAAQVPLPESASDIRIVEGMEMNAFQYLEATIILIKRPRGSNEARIIVASENYKEEEVVDTPRHVYY